MPAGVDHSERSLTSLNEGWRTWLRVRHGTLADLHEDLIQQATADLLEWEQRQPARVPDETLRRVGFRILERRVYDSFRGEVRRWASEPADPDDLESPDHGPEQSAEYAKLLKALIEVLTHLRASDRALVLRDEFSKGRSVALSPAERKRLSRLRKELKEQMLTRHGIDVDAM